MRDFFTGLVEKNFGTAEVIRPIIPSRYAPPHSGVSHQISLSEIMGYEEVPTGTTYRVPEQKSRTPFLKSETSTDLDRRPEKVGAVERLEHVYSVPEAQEAGPTQAYERQASIKPLGRNAHSDLESWRPRSIRPQVKRREPDSRMPEKRLHEEPSRIPVSEGKAGNRSIRVHIGRIEVRAVTQPEPKPERKSQPQTKPSLTLDEYLKKRSRGER